MAKRQIARNVALRSYPIKSATPVSAQALQATLVAKSPASKQSRQHFGRAISMDRIDISLRSAWCGMMRDLTDLSRETIDTDPHLASVLNKRFAPLATLPRELTPASGYGVDPEKAAFYAEVVKDQFKAMANFSRLITDLAWGLFDGRAADELKWIEVNGPTHSKYGRVSMAVEKAEWIHPRRLSFGPNRELVVTDEARAPFGFERMGLVLDSIPYKFVTFMSRLFGEYPEREGLGPRTLYWSFFKRFGARERMVLLELYGKPWRIIEQDEDSSAGGDDARLADAVIDALGATFTARLPRGFKVNIVQPGATAGAVHKDVIEDSDKQISKLVLGQTATTDAAPAGMNNQTANVAQDEQLAILTRDAAEISEVIEDHIVDAIIAVNFGPAEVDHAPSFRLRSDLPISRVEELKRLDGALSVGLQISVAEAYEVSGFRVPRENEPVIRIEQPPTPDNSPVAPAPRAVIIYPPNQSPASGEQQPAAKVGSQGPGGAEPSASVSAPDAKATVTVNEDRLSRGLEPLIDPETGAPDPDGDLTIIEFEAKRGALESDETETLDEPTVAPAPLTPEVVDPKNALNGAQVTALLEIVARVAQRLLPRASGIAAMLAAFPISREQAEEIMGEVGTTFFATPEQAPQLRTTALERVRKVMLAKAHAEMLENIDLFEELGDESAYEVSSSIHAARLRDNDIAVMLSTVCDCDADSTVTLAAKPQPATKNGSPDTILSRALVEIRQPMSKLAASFISAVAGKSSVAEVLGALSTARSSLDVRVIARPLERRMIQAAALGALDSFDDTVDTVTTATKNAPKDFSKLPFSEAAKEFKARRVVQRHLFDALEANAKRKAFTVAGVMADQMLGSIHDELSKEVAKGASMRDFGKAIDARLKSAGFVATLQPLADGSKALNASHVETVFRTNVLGSYNQGRATHMSDPEVTKRRPVWQIRGVNQPQKPDGTGTRPTHAAAHGKMLLASDPFWKTAYPPFGYSCRCRVVARPASFMKVVVSGSTIKDLPDPGFASGIGSFF